MKHPDREEWVPFIFGEAGPDTRRRLARHLEECPECARELAGWQRSLRKLDDWALPPAPAQHLVLFPRGLRWAVAAVLVLGLGLLAGRLSAPRAVNAAELRAQVEASVRSSLRVEMQDALGQVQHQTSAALNATEVRLAQASALESERVWRSLVEVLNAARAEDGRSVQALFHQYQQQHEAEYVALRKDLETLAATADQEIRQARLRLVQLAANRDSVQ